MTLQAISAGEEPVLLVVHEDDRQGGWQYLPLRDWHSRELVLVHGHHLIDTDP